MPIPPWMMCGWGCAGWDTAAAAEAAELTVARGIAGVRLSDATCSGRVKASNHHAAASGKTTTKEDIFILVAVASVGGDDRGFFEDYEKAKFPMNKSEAICSVMVGWLVACGGGSFESFGAGGNGVRRQPKKRTSASSDPGKMRTFRRHGLHRGGHVRVGCSHLAAGGVGSSSWSNAANKRILHHGDFERTSLVARLSSHFILGREMKCKVVRTAS